MSETPAPRLSRTLNGSLLRFELGLVHKHITRICGLGLVDISGGGSDEFNPVVAVLSGSRRVSIIKDRNSRPMKA